MTADSARGCTARSPRCDMIQIRCPMCGETVLVPEVHVCPLCGLDLRKYTEELARKHVIRCKGERKR